METEGTSISIAVGARMRISSIPQIYRHVARWREILAVLSKYGLADWIGRLGPEFAKGLLKDREGLSPRDILPAARLIARRSVIWWLDDAAFQRDSED